MKFTTTTLALFAATATSNVAASALAKPYDEYAEEMIRRRLSTKGGKSSSMSHSTKSGKSNSSKSSKKVQESIDKLGFDIYGDSSMFDPSSSIEVDDDCQYTATVRLQLADADVPFPPVMPGPDGPGSCILEGTDCNGQSCLNEVRNVYSFSKEFEEVTGFNHVGADWSPCGQ